jgi:hypothetical protein
MAASDALAKGAHKAQFPPAGGRISQERWDAIWADEPETEQKKDEIEEKG